jgi:hypothetical protein
MSNNKIVNDRATANCEQERKWIVAVMASFKVLHQQPLGGSDGRHKKLQAVQLRCYCRFKPGTFQIQWAG